MSEAVLKLEKVKKSCRISKNISRVLAIIVTLGCAMCLVGAIVLLIVGSEKIDSKIQLGVDEGNVRIEMNYLGTDGIFSIDLHLNELIEQGRYTDAFIEVCNFGALISAIVATMFWTLVSMFKLIEESENPFTPKVLKQLKRVFVLATIMAGLLNGLVACVVTACIGRSLYSIFDYGFVIQQEIDETL